MRILVIEDDKKIASFVTRGLKQAGFAVDCARDGDEGLFLALNEPYDAAVVDIMIPKIDGLSVIRELRKRHLTTPVIILSAKRSVEDRVRGLQSGSDDYLVKPFSFSELLARVQALIRRSDRIAEPMHLKFGELSMDLAMREVRWKSKNLCLQPREFSLLEFLMRNEGRIVSKTLIMEHVWDYNFDPQTNVVDVLVCRLRNKLDREIGRKFIHTIRGVGYVFRQSQSSP